MAAYVLAVALIVRVRVRVRVRILMLGITLRLDSTPNSSDIHLNTKG